MKGAIHRIVEEQAAARGDATAVIGVHDSLTYRDLNARANAVARDLVSRGFRRGGHALVVLERGRDLAIVLLAVLKAGGCYTWLDPADAEGYPRGVSIAAGGGADEDRYLTLDVARLMDQTRRSGPNLPIMMRADDVAIVLEGREDGSHVLIPHASVTALAAADVPARVEWGGEPGALDLWLGLMAGVTLTLGEAARVAA